MFFLDYKISLNDKDVEEIKVLDQDIAERTEKLSPEILRKCIWWRRCKRFSRWHC